jgi:two-component system cell cycle sensor histidine kinase/response regulator CckA
MDELVRLRKENEKLKKEVASLTEELSSRRSVESLATVARAVDYSLSGIAVADGKWRIRYANPAMVSLWGYDSVDEVIGHKTVEFVSDLGREQIAEVAGAVLTDGSWKGEIVGRRKDGSTFPVFMAGSRLIDGSGTFSGVVASCIDMTDYRRVLDALGASEERYRTTLDHLGYSVYLVDRDLTLLFVNRRFNEVMKSLGKDVERNVGKKITEIDFSPFRDVETELRSVIESGTPLTLEEEVTVLGTKVFIEKRRVPIMRDGAVTNVVSIIRNITQRRLYEEELKESEEKYRVITDSVPVGVFIHVAGAIKYAGREAARMLGYNFDEIVGMNIMDFIHEDDRAIVIDRAKRRAAGEDVPVGYEVRAVKKDGTILPILIYGSVIDYLGEKAIQGVFIDISVRKKFERELSETLDRLRKSEERYRILVESSNDGVAVISDYKMVFLNQRFSDFLGRGRDELLNRPFLDMVYDEDREFVLDNYERRLAKKDAPDRYEFRIVTKDESIMAVEISVVLIEWEGKPSSLCLFRDVSEKRVAEEERAGLHEQLLHAQKMEAIGTLAGGMAHNFNNILVGIMGYSEYLLISKSQNDPDYKALKTIHEGSVRASELTRQLLNIGRGGEFNRTKISLNDVARRVLPLITGTFDKSIEIETDLDDRLMVMEGDMGQLEQSLLNVCINARDAMPDGGKLLIETENRWLDDGFVRAHLGSRVGHYVSLSVTDTGVGMSREIKDHIFEPFFTTKKHAGGSGMGLATVWGIVKNHQGLVAVYSEPGKGSAFRLYFPAILVEVEGEELKKEDIRPGQGETLLLVDDEQIIREMWGDILNELGYRVLTAGGGEEALAVLEERRGDVDLVILDLVMPHMGGKETFSRIRERYPGVRVLVSSGYSENGKPHEILDAGADGFIQKPYQIGQVTIKVREMLDGRENEEP